ncbi:MAG TPA: hypothetical protein PKM88_11215, partial [bacterium]|nr:hypothetical protein [bacterium]
CHEVGRIEGVVVRGVPRHRGGAVHESTAIGPRDRENGAGKVAACRQPAATSKVQMASVSVPLAVPPISQMVSPAETAAAELEVCGSAGPLTHAAAPATAGESTMPASNASATMFCRNGVWKTQSAIAGISRAQNAALAIPIARYCPG